jgi:hypothetical protein
MDPLEDPPVRRSSDGQGLVGQVARDVTEERPNREVLVDDDHGSGSRSVVVGVGVEATAEQRVGRADRRERIGELVGEIAHRDPPEDLLVALGQSRVTCPPLTTELLEQILPGRGHPAIVPVSTLRRTRQFAVPVTYRDRIPLGGPHLRYRSAR